MAQFIDIHRGMKDITAEQLKEEHDKDAAIEKEEDVHFLKAWADPESGTVCCLSEAPSADAVQRIHERSGRCADEIHAVALSIG
jgi:hypothetical protein